MGRECSVFLSYASQNLSGKQISLSSPMYNIEIVVVDTTKTIIEIRFDRNYALTGTEFYGMDRIIGFVEHLKNLKLELKHHSNGPGSISVKMMS